MLSLIVATGPHTVSVLVNGDEHVGGSPFICNIYDVTKVLVSGLGSSKVDLVIIRVNFRLTDTFHFRWANRLPSQ